MNHKQTVCSHLPFHSPATPRHTQGLHFQQPRGPFPFPLKVTYCKQHGVDYRWKRRAALPLGYFKKKKLPEVRSTQGRAGHWRGLHDAICITIHGSWYNYIMLGVAYCNILQYSTLFAENVKTAEIQIAVCDLLSLNASHHVILIIQMESKQFYP